MPNNEGGFDHIPSAEELLATYKTEAQNDPRSLYYERKLTKPKLHPVRALLFMLMLTAPCVGIAFLLFGISDSIALSVCVGIGLWLLACLLTAKHIAVWLVRLYQVLAPERIRRKCRYEPSCSDYMILSLQKYGFLRGLVRGVQRLLRCKPPNGGSDPP